MTVVSAHAPTARAAATGRELFVLVAAAQLAASLQFIMIGVALPDLVDDLDTSLRWASWTISLFTMTQALSLPVLGRLSDALGRRAVFVGGLATFGVASLICSIAPNVAVLIAARAVQGIGAGSLMPSAYGIIGDAYAGPQRARALGLLSSIFPIGAVLGPNIGGLLVEQLGWRSTFLFNAPIAAMAGVWGWRRLPRGRRTGEHVRVNHVGAVLLALTIGGLMIAITELGREEGNASGTLVAGCVIGAIVAGAWFAHRERRSTRPLLGIDLLWRRPFGALNALNFLYGVCVFGMVSFVPLYARDAYGFDATQAGVLLVPRALAMVAASVLASMLIVRTGFRRPIGAGLVTMAVSGLLLACGPGLAARSGLSDFAYLAAVLGVLGLGLGVAGPSANQAGVDLLPDQVAAITGLRGMFRALGGSLGTAAIAAIASRSPSHGVGLERSFAIIAGISLAAVALLGAVPGRDRR